MKRVLIGIGLVTLGFVLLIVIEVVVARRVQRLEPFDRAQLDGLVGEGEGEPLRMVWLGDSTGDGVGASSPDHVLPRVVAAGLGKRVELTVLAKSGARVVDVIKTQLPSLAALRPQLVVVGIAGNDVTHLTSRSRLRTGLDRLLEGVRASGAERVVLVGVGEFASTPLLAEPLRFLAGLRADQFNAEMRAAAQRHGAIFVDIIARTGKRFADDPKRYHAVDHFHPSDDGYALWARAVLDVLAGS